jgi:hypothetical protein
MFFWSLKPEGNNVFLAFDLDQNHGFWLIDPKVENYRKCFFDLWTRKKTMFLDFWSRPRPCFFDIERKSKKIQKMFFWPHANKQANAFIFFHNTLPTVEGIMINFMKTNTITRDIYWWPSWHYSQHRWTINCGLKFGSTLVKTS